MQELSERAVNEAREPVEKRVLELSSTLIFIGTEFIIWSQNLDILC